MFDFLQREPSYTGSDKDWYVELNNSTCFWYDLLPHPPEGFNMKQQIADYLKQLQAIVESQLDKRFIYFLAARKKLRFCVGKKPKYSFFGNDLFFYVEIGRERIRRKVTTKILDSQTRQPIKPPVEISDRFITFHYTPDHKVSLSIHDFLQDSGIELGINTEIHYVGYTRSPSERPINGAHSGLSDMLYRVSNDEHDFFVFFNLFKVSSIGMNRSAPINFCVANSMVDEVKVDEEGRIIEKALIRYFSTEAQDISKRNEESELENSLERLAAKNNINSVAIHIEMEEPSELHRFFSRSVEPSDKHLFTCRMRNGGIEIIDGANLAVSVL
ncbi:hypothetical protein F6R98_17590 [Candidatus Methylospira mobilis]|uniref:Uncharacterized protein n=2 Tax=Candidatus Methylospira mobilis TaxID=1808979 RepID=A0A5Q0BM53_9GAMM|nr:hypothetical protein F6R98_17590 [Candidatus Methylospira mobilis]